MFTAPAVVTKTIPSLSQVNHNSEEKRRNLVNPVERLFYGEQNLAVMSLGESLKRWRLRRKLSQADVGRMIGVSGNTVWNLENGVTQSFKLEGLRKLQEIMGDEFPEPDSSPLPVDLLQSMRDWVGRMFEGSDAEKDQAAAALAAIASAGTLSPKEESAAPGATDMKIGRRLAAKPKRKPADTK